MGKHARKKSGKAKIIIPLVSVCVILALCALYLEWRGTAELFYQPAESASALPGQYTVSNQSGWHTIDNQQYGIDNTGKNARQTTDGINKALLDAKKSGYQNIRFEKGTYLIQCNWNNRFIAPTDGILVPSGLTLDLSDCTFRMEPNAYPAYCIFGIVNQSNVKILNGTLIGDLQKHQFAASVDSPSHEWGFGINVSASTDIVIEGVAIRDMTGDGIILEGSYKALSDGGKVCSNIKIYGCDISNCRRQGISVIGAPFSEIAKNTIYNIKGTDPQYGIDIEPEFDYPVNGLKIHDNTVSGCMGGAVSCSKGSGYEVYNNTCKGNIIAVNCQDVKIYGNSVESSFIRVYKQAVNVTVQNNRLDLLSRLILNR